MLASFSGVIAHQSRSTQVQMGLLKRSNACGNEDTMAQLKIIVDLEDHVQGRIDAPIKLVEYGDYECPHCGLAYPIVKSLQRQFGDHLRFIFRNFPLRESHPHAQAAAETAEFAGAHGRFWEMHDAIFENQQRLSQRVFSSYRSVSNSMLALWSSRSSAATFVIGVNATFPAESE